jgi:DNA-binding response OmpR family regulator
MEKRILIIDDDKDILEALTDLLELEGYTIQVNPKGDRTVEAITSFHPHIILLDLLLSGIDGATISKQIRKTQGMETLPIIIMSAHPYAQKAIEGSGANEFLRKPFDVEQLLTLLKKYIPIS